MSEFWRKRSTWVIDPVGGNDSDFGNDNAHAVKTWGEVLRRWEDDVVLLPQATSITFRSSQLATDPFYLNVAVTSGKVEVLGEPVASPTSTFTAVTPTNRATQTMQGVTDSSVTSWPVARLVVMGGARDGAIAWAAKDLTNHAARTTTFTKANAADPYAAIMPPQLGDTYQVLTLPSLQLSTVHATLGGLDPAAMLRFSNLDLRAVAQSSGGLGGELVPLSLVGCLLDQVEINAGYVTAVGCLFGRPGSPNLNHDISDGAFMTSLGCLYLSAWYLGEGATFEIDYDTLLQGLAHKANIESNSRLDIGQCAIFDATASGTLMINAGTVRTLPLYAATDLLWGAGNQGPVKMTSGGRLLYTTKPTVTNINAATAGEVRVCDVPRAWADCPFVHEELLAGVVPLVV